MNDKLVGMTCRITNQNQHKTHICSLCNHIGNGNEVASALCKTDTSSESAYKSIGFDMCLNSAMCNERIISTEKLEKILMNVNNIK